MDWYHPTLGLISASSGFVLADIQYPSGWLRQATDAERTALGFIPVQMGNRPDDKLFFVGGTVVTVVDGVCHVEYEATPRDPADIAKANALAEIDRLERSITDRMWREDAVGSTALMYVSGVDEDGNGFVNTDDPRHGKTATQYIAWVNDAIAALRGGL
jgi:hypothetical protein